MSGLVFDGTLDEGTSSAQAIDRDRRLVAKHGSS